MPENAKQLYDRGRIAMQDDFHEEAISLFQHSATLKPHFKTLELLGECLLKIGRNTEAIIPLAASATLNTGVRSLTLLAEALFLSKDVMKAKEVVNAALKKDENNRRAKKLLERISVDDET